jgi:hypothetical protein
MISDDDVTLIIEALFDIRTELRKIRDLLEDESGEQEEENDDGEP